MMTILYILVMAQTVGLIFYRYPFLILVHVDRPLAFYHHDDFQHHFETLQRELALILFLSSLCNFYSFSFFFVVEVNDVAKVVLYIFKIYIISLYTFFFNIYTDYLYALHASFDFQLQTGY